MFTNRCTALHHWDTVGARVLHGNEETEDPSHMGTL